MFCIDILLEDFDVVEFMESNGFELQRIGGRTGYLTDCPFCGKEKHFGLSPERKFYGCYKCHTSGDYIRLIMKVLNRTYWEVLEILKEKVNTARIDVAYIGDIIKEFKEISLTTTPKPITLPEGYTSLVDSRIPYLDSGRKFPIPQDQVNYYKMGICYEGRYKDRLIICDVDENQVPIFWIARDITGKADTKVLNPPAKEVGSGDVLFNYFLAKNYNIGILTEGLFDALHVGNCAMATYGEGLKKSHLSWLLQSSIKDVVLLYDADVPYEKLEVSAIKISEFFSTRICKLPYGDPDEYPKDKLWEYIINSPKYTPSDVTRIDLQWK